MMWAPNTLARNVHYPVAANHPQTQACSRGLELFSSGLLADALRKYRQCDADPQMELEMPSWYDRQELLTSEHPLSGFIQSMSLQVRGFKQESPFAFTRTGASLWLQSPTELGVSELPRM